MKYLFGKLTDRDLVGLLRWVYLRRRTGILEVGRDDAKKRLHFIAGELYIARSHPLAARLDRYLHLETPHRPAGGEPGPAPASGELHELLNRIAEHLCAWQVESYRFIESPPSGGAELVGPLPTAQLLMEAAASHFNEAELVARLGGGEATIVARPAADDRAAESELGADEAFLYYQLQTPQALGKLLESPADERQRWLTALCRLWAVDLVAQTNLLERREAPAAERSRTAPTSYPPRAAEPRPRLAAEPHPRAAAEPRPRPEPHPHIAAGPPPPAPPAAWPEVDDAAFAAEPVGAAADPAVLALWRDHFHLRGEPFALTPDPAFLFLSEGHAEVLAGLKLGLLERRGLIVVTGEVGTGKTTLVYSLLSDIGPRVETAYLANTALGFEDLLQSALHDFEVPVASTRRLDLLAAFNRFLLASARQGKVVALVVDEAQNLTDEIFEELRLLLNFETYAQKLLQIVLVGQPELGAKLASPRLRQVADRIAVRCHLSPLGAGDVRRYVDHRLESVGGSEELFTRRALSLVVRKSRGIPRRVNILCHNALLFAYGRGETRVDRSQVAAAARGLAPGRRPGRFGDGVRELVRRLADRRRLRPLLAGVLACLAAAAIALVAFQLGAARRAVEPEAPPVQAAEAAHAEPTR